MGAVIIPCPKPFKSVDRRRVDMLVALIEERLDNQKTETDRKFGEMLRAASEPGVGRSEEHTSELQSLMRISYAVFCLKTKRKHHYTLSTYDTIQVRANYSNQTTKSKLVQTDII